MKPLTRRILTHAGCVIAGIGLMAALGGVASSGGEITKEETRKDKKLTLPFLPERPDRKDAAKRTEHASFPDGTAKRYRASEYKAAWDAIAFKDVTIQQRIELQQALLQQWALVDLEGAMAAVLAGPWDGHYQEGGIDALLGSFSEAFTERPLEAWDLIQSGKFGPGSALFREAWVNSVAGQEPLLAVSLMGSMSQRVQMNVLNRALGRHAGDPDMRRQILAKLGEMPEDTPNLSGLVAQAFKISPSDGDPAGYREAIANATSDQARTMALHEYLSSLRNLDATALRAEWSQLPPELQARAATGLFNSPTGVKNAPEVLDLIMETGQWDRLKDPTAQNNLRSYARTLDGVDLASWGMKLPERPETIEIFRRAVDPYISRNIGDAKGWIETLPQGWHRDRALGQFSQHALWGSKNPELSQWALDSISDPKIRAEVAKWRGDWAKQTGYQQVEFGAPE